MLNFIIRSNTIYFVLYTLNLNVWVFLPGRQVWEYVMPLAGYTQTVTCYILATYVDNEVPETLGCFLTVRQYSIKLSVDLWWLPDTSAIIGKEYKVTREDFFPTEEL
jgi:hypothetical protein